MDAAQRQLVISLPKSGGQRVKDALKQVASMNHRTVSNLTFIIISEWLEKNGHLNDEGLPSPDSEGEF